jgi:hypothetical protein
MTFTATLYRDTFGLMFGLGLFFVKLSSCSPNSMLAPAQANASLIGESPDERESRSVTQRLRRAVIFRFSHCPALNKSIAQTRKIIGRGTNANFVALSDRDLSRLQKANDAVATIASFRGYGALRCDLYLRGLRGDHHAHNQNRKVISSLRQQGSGSPLRRHKRS